MSTSKYTRKSPKHQIKPGTIILSSYARWLSGVVVCASTQCHGRVAGFTIVTNSGKHEFVPAEDALLVG